MESESEQRVPGYCALCTSRCGCISIVEDGRLKKVEPNSKHPTGSGLCGKGRAAPELVNHPDRLLYPLRRSRAKGDPDPGWQRITWDEALDAIASELKETAASNGPEAVAFGITTPSGTGLQDAYPWVERLRNAFGSPNAVFGTEICNFHRDDVHALSFGVATPMPDFENTDCLVLWGHNPSATWLSFATRAAQAKMRGAKLIVVDPRQEGLANKADLWLRVRPGSDGALALGITNLLIAENRIDKAFLQNWSNAPFLLRQSDGQLLRESDLKQDGDPASCLYWDEAADSPVVHTAGSGSLGRNGTVAALRGSFDVIGADGTVIPCRTVFDHYAELCADYPPERVEEITWVPADQLRQAVELIGQAGAYSCYTWSGVGQHTNASQGSRAIHLLAALRGSFDAPGGNVIFDSVETADVMGRDLLSAEQADKAIGVAKRPVGPQAQGWITTDDLYRAILEGDPYRVTAMVNFGTNILLSHADGGRGREALKALDFVAHCDLFMTPSAELADIVLPVGTPWEREGLCTDFAVGRDASSYVQLRPAAVAARGESRSDLWIVCELAKRLGLSEQFWGGEIDDAFRAALAPSGLTLEALRGSPEGLEVPLEVRYRKYEDSGFATRSGVVEFYSEILRDIGQAPLPDYVEPTTSPISRPDLAKDYPFVLTSAKTMHYCHSQHRGLPAQRKREPDPRVELHPLAAEGRGIEDGDWIRVVTPHGEVMGRAHLKEGIDPRVVSATAGWWQACDELGLPGFDAAEGKGANLNAAIGNEEADPISGSVPHRSYLCDVLPLTRAAD